jgi:hypothetical protein
MNQALYAHMNNKRKKKKAVLSPSHIFGNFFKNKVGMAVRNHIWVFYSVPLVFLSVFLPVPCCFYCYDGIVIPPVLLFLLSFAWLFVIFSDSK